MSVIFYDARELAQYAHRGADIEDLADVSAANAVAYNRTYSGETARPVMMYEIKKTLESTKLDPSYHAGGGLRYNCVANDGTNFAEGIKHILERIEAAMLEYQRRAVR